MHTKSSKDIGLTSSDEDDSGGNDNSSSSVSSSPPTAGKIDQRFRSDNKTIDNCKFEIMLIFSFQYVYWDTYTYLYLLYLYVFWYTSIYDTGSIYLLFNFNIYSNIFKLSYFIYTNIYL